MTGRKRQRDGERQQERSELIREALEEQRRAFREKFGRDPQPADPVIFDPEADEPRQIDEESFALETAAIMKDAQIDPAFIHAWLKTGLLVTESNRDVLSHDDLDEWEEAVDEYQMEAIAKHLRQKHGFSQESSTERAVESYRDSEQRACPVCHKDLE